MKKSTKQNILFAVSIVGPGLITVNAGNDAGGIATYASVGASYGYSMLWGLLLITFSLATIQEMNARMAVVTGKGLADLIREQFGVKWTFFAMLVLFVANFGVTVGDFAGIAASMQIFGISKYLSVPVMAGVIWLMVAQGSYTKTERIFLGFTLVFFSYIATAFIVKPNWGQVLRATFTPTLRFDQDYLLTFIGMIGTTITPYMQFYLQSTVVDKGLSIEHYKYEQLDVYLGAVWGNLVSFFIIVGTAVTLFSSGLEIQTAQDAALALKPIAGRYASFLFAIGLFGASVLAATIIPLSTTYAIAESFGFERGMDKSPRQAPVFYGIFTGIIALAAVLVLIPNMSLIGIMLATQQLAGILSPVVLIFMVFLINNRDIMGGYVNSKLQNIVIWVTVGFIIALSLILFLSQVVRAFL